MWHSKLQSGDNSVKIVAPLLVLRGEKCKIKKILFRKALKQKQKKIEVKLNDVFTFLSSSYILKPFYYYQLYLMFFSAESLLNVMPTVACDVFVVLITIGMKIGTNVHLLYKFKFLLGANHLLTYFYFYVYILCYFILFVFFHLKKKDFYIKVVKVI